MNKSYGKLTGGQIEYAPESIETESGVVVNPTAESYLAAGWKKVVDVPPAPEEGCEVAISKWIEDETTITCVYKQVPKKKDYPRTFSKLKLVSALKAKDRWVLVKTWIEEKGYYDYYVAAQYFTEDHAVFVEAVEAVKRYTGMSDAEVEEILSKCVYEP